MDSLAVGIGEVPPARRRIYLYYIGTYWATEDPETPEMTAGNGQRIIPFFSDAWRRQDQLPGGDEDVGAIRNPR
jgi:hypothetical protein